MLRQSTDCYTEVPPAVPQSTDRYTGRLIVRLAAPVVRALADRAQHGDADPDSLVAVAELLDLQDLQALCAQFPDVQSPPLIRRWSVIDLTTMEEAASEGPFPPVHSLTSYYALYKPAWGTVSSEQMLIGLNHITEVDVAYREPGLRNPAWLVPPPNDTDFVAGLQGYLDGEHTYALPITHSGINANCEEVWGQKYDGRGYDDGTGAIPIGFAMLDSGWEAHPDLPAITLLNPPNVVSSDPNDRDHGTSALGIVVATTNNALGIAAIAPKANLVGAVSRVEAPPVFPLQQEKWDVADAILQAVSHLSAGDVLLLEVETVDQAIFDTESNLTVNGLVEGYPIEIADHWFDAIRFASSQGIVVIEPAGNGYGNLDGWTSSGTGNRSLKRGDADFVDSGAVMVSACHRSLSATGQHKFDNTYHDGSRVDCYAWSEYVQTTLSHPKSPDYGLFGGTSAASAIIAGAAIVVQDMWQQKRSTPVQRAVALPTPVRALLSNWKLGTAIMHNSGQIGVMPDLKRIAGDIQAIPDVYIRDSVMDVGVMPHTQVYSSPDIIVRSEPVTNPDQQFGAASPLADVVPANDAIAPDKDNHFYVRMKNLGPQPALQTRIRLYWSEASALVAPNDWNPIRTTAGDYVLDAGDVPANDQLHVAGPFVWHPTGSEVPASGHGCFVAVLDQDMDPAPPLLPPNDPLLGTPTDWNTFLSYVGVNNNVAWRNFTVDFPSPTGGGSILVAGAPDAAGAPGAGAVPDMEAVPGNGYEFLIRGAADLERVFDLHILFELGEEDAATWIVPADLQRRLIWSDRAGAGLPATDTEPTAIRGGFAYSLSGRGSIYARALALRPGEAFSCRLVIHAAPGDDPRWRGVVMRQLYEGLEVGRLTWMVREPVEGELDER